MRGGQERSRGCVINDVWFRPIENAQEEGDERVFFKSKCICFEFVQGVAHRWVR